MASININVESECMTSCCTENMQHKPISKEDKTQQSNSHCHPFMSCSNCFCFTIPIFLPRNAPIQNNIEISIIYLQPAYQQAIQSIWRPPKIA